MNAPTQPVTPWRPGHCWNDTQHIVDARGRIVASIRFQPDQEPSHSAATLATIIDSVNERQGNGKTQ